jgi:transposase-like protein
VDNYQLDPDFHLISRTLPQRPTSSAFKNESIRRSVLIDPDRPHSKTAQKPFEAAPRDHGTAKAQKPPPNAVLEQDHRAIKRRVRASQHFRSFWGAWRTIAGYEAIHIIRKGPEREGVRQV